MRNEPFFKKINDSYGHSFGDAVLKEIAVRLISGLREYDHIGRFGGEEFLVVLCEADFPTAAAVAERLRQVICHPPMTLGEQAMSVTISVGIVHASDLQEVVDAEYMIVIADEALYEAKNAGRNRIEARRIFS